MREVELLDALCCAGLGLQVTYRPGNVTIDTGYAPYVRGHGETLFKAAVDTALKVRAEAVDPSLPVLAKLEDYDRHSAMLQL